MATFTVKVTKCISHDVSRLGIPEQAGPEALIEDRCFAQVLLAMETCALGRGNALILLEPL
jgi:hypothetical protein